MAGKSPIFTSGIKPGFLYLQPGSAFTDHDYGIDTGRRTFLTHPTTPESKYPQRGQTDTQYRGMYVVDATWTQDASTMIEITVTYKGYTRGSKAVKVAGSAGTQMIVNGNFQVGIPVPKISLEYVTVSQPTHDGVGQAATGFFLPTPPALGSSFVFSEPPVRNLITGWVLESRTWDPDASVVWEVREDYSYFYEIGG